MKHYVDDNRHDCILWNTEYNKYLEKNTIKPPSTVAMKTKGSFEKTAKEKEAEDPNETSKSPDGFCYTKKSAKPLYKDFKRNGQYCKHGIAMRRGQDEAICTEFDHMTWND